MALEAEEKVLDVEAYAAYFVKRAEQQADILRRIREGPHAYKAQPADRPPRPDGRGKR